jgi:hypothetical protein
MKKIVKVMTDAEARALQKGQRVHEAWGNNTRNATITDVQPAPFDLDQVDYFLTYDTACNHEHMDLGLRLDCDKKPVSHIAFVNGTYRLGEYDPKRIYVDGPYIVERESGDEP